MYWCFSCSPCPTRTVGIFLEAKIDSLPGLNCHGLLPRTLAMARLRAPRLCRPVRQDKGGPSRTHRRAVLAVEGHGGSRRLYHSVTVTAQWPGRDTSRPRTQTPLAAKRLVEHLLRNRFTAAECSRRTEVLPLALVPLEIKGSQSSTDRLPYTDWLYFHE